MPAAESRIRAVPIAGVLAWVLALVFLATGLGKALDVAGFAAVLGTYRLLPADLLGPVAALVVAVELAIVAGLVRPRWRRGAAVAAALVAAGNATVLVATLARGITLENCGCFGVFLARPLSWAMPAEDLALFALAWVVARLA
ncbi:MAG: MauE/DoxX family redox-associated membrane protein [Pseudomonadota bacterium]